MTPPISRRNMIQSTVAGATLVAAGARTTAGVTTTAQASNQQEITAMSAASLSKAIANRDVSCVAVMQAFLAQISEHNPKHNAIVSLVGEDSLMSQATQADTELENGLSRGWMHGFPIAVKDLANAQGLHTTSGSPIFKDNIATSDSIHIARMKAAGGIVVGKTNVPEFGLGSQTYNSVFGATLNAYDGISTAGGSSGGAAVSLALRMTPVADGSDYMGSLRNPGAFNNVIGFRPTPGTVPLNSTFGEEFPCNGPMARNVTDTALLLSTMAGQHADSPTSLPGDPARFAAPLDRDFKNSKIAWLADFDGYLPMQDGVLDLCEKALGAFTDVGCVVEATKSPFDMAALWQTWLTFRHWSTRAKALTLYENPTTRAQLKPEAIWEVEGGANLTGDDISNASATRGQFYAALQKLFEKYDYLVLPTAQVFPFPATTHWPKEVGGRQMDTYHRWMEVVVAGTFSGCPVANVPAGFSADGKPMGLQIIGKRYQDFSTLQMAYAYEQASRLNLDHTPFNRA